MGKFQNGGEDVKRPGEAGNCGKTLRKPGKSTQILGMILENLERHLQTMEKQQENLEKLFHFPDEYKIR